MEKNLRKVIKIGNSYYVSLPKSWIRRWGISDGELVDVSLREDGVLEILPLSTSDVPRKLVVDCKEDLNRKIVSAYLHGYDVIEVALGMCPLNEVLGKIKPLLSILTGLEVVEEDSNKISLQCFIRSNYSVVQLLKLMDKLSRGMYLDALKSLLEKDSKLAESVIERDNRVDRLYFLTVRVIRTSLLKGSLSSKERLLLMDMRLLARDLEEIADISEEIAKTSLKLLDKSYSETICLKLESVAKKLSDVQEKIVNSVLSNKPQPKSFRKNLMNIREQLNSIMSECTKENALDLMEIGSLIKMLYNKVLDIEDLLPIL
ncbi:MAG: hypothetical protein DRN04_11250 [Thermoprotei archaeon]|nr:MAG: hypothetical protein DRN04_11250 [Thermoprotei archaeon]